MTSTTRVLAMVSAVNTPTYPLTTETVALTGLAVENASTHNTRVSMHGLPGRGYTGQVDLFYTRVLLSAMGELAFKQEAPFTYQGVLDLINQTKHAQVSLEDFTNSGLPEVENGTPKAFTLSADPSSFAWLGNTQVTLLAGIPESAPDFVDFINNTAATLFNN